MPEPYSIGKLTRKRADGTDYWSYCIIWWNERKRQRISLGTTDRLTAEAKARQAWCTLRPALDLNTVGAVVNAYLGTDDAPRPVPDRKRKAEAWQAAQTYWANMAIDAIDESSSLAYPAWRQRSANTVRQELSLVRTALNWAAGQKLTPSAPKVTLPPMPESKVEHLTKAQFRAFLAGCATPHVRLFAMLAVTTGGRKSAILEAKWTQVDFERALFSLNPEGRRQNSKYRATVPLNELILPALRDAHKVATTGYIIEHKGEPLADIKKGIGAAARRSGLKVHPHMFRHSAAVWMAEDRVPMPEIASFLGHRDINVTTRVYARYHPDYLRTASQSLSW
ncbi:tyrosine-type recombinase/integrase [Novosphingobium sp. FSY-8]|uniref:Tyrosine-type recombinase/integrase n=1 Tax=Novosphingobium ovatum TaxID=1908523 RepID=A0ABW9XHT9_9SPHN|nr:site-specific integrase [Novosphingobium ovatum]NBC38014.1 tyrosine-type recombinase/integrase [Novosphingobium ovatum]